MARTKKQLLRQWLLRPPRPAAPAPRHSVETLEHRTLLAVVTFPSAPGLDFQTSGPARPATVGDWYTSNDSSSTDRAHYVLVEVTPAMLSAGGGTVNITVEDAESTNGPNAVDEVANASDPTRFRLLASNRSTVLASTTVPSGTADNTSVVFPVTTAGTYYVQSVSGAFPISGDATATLNDDDNAYRVTVSQDGGLVGQYQASFQQSVAGSRDLYFVVGVGTTSLYLRNFDVDGTATVTYTKPNGTTIAGTASDNGVWNGPTPTLNTGGDTISGLTAADAGLWKVTFGGWNTGNQIIFEANTGTAASPGDRIILVDTTPTAAGNFSIASDGTLSTTLNTPGDHVFTVTNNFAADDIIDLSLSGTAANFTAQLLTAGGAPLTDSTGDGSPDTGVLNSGESRNFILRVTPTSTAAGTDTTRITGVSVLDKGIDVANNTTHFIDRTTIRANGAPVHTVPGTQSVSEDGAPRVFSTANSNRISVADADLVGGNLTVTLTAVGGSLTLSGTAGLSFGAGDATADATMTFTGTQAAVNAALDGLTYQQSANFNGAGSVRIVTSDNGNTGAGGAQSDDDTVIVNVTATNDGPVNTVPGAQTTAEDIPVVFSTANGNAVSVADIDAGSNPVRVTLTGSSGAVTLATTSGLAFSTGDGTADATMTFTGTLAAVNAAMDGMSFVPAANYNGPGSLQVLSNDQGNTGAGSPLSDSDTVAITITALNDPPINSVPAAQAFDEDTTLVFSTGNGNRISFSDVDAGTGPVTVTLTATGGTLTLGTTAGVSFGAGDGTADATMTFTGTAANLNTALNNLTFTPPANYTGAASVQISVNDGGNTGAGGPQTDTDTVAITVNAVDDPPVNVVPGAQATAEDTAFTFSVAGGNAISVSDLDAGGGAVRVTLIATSGLVTLSGTTGLAFSAGDGTADATVTFAGTVADVNAAMNGMAFLPSADFNGTAHLQVTTNDQGNTGTGGPLTDVDTVSIAVSAANDAPVNSVPSPQAVNEDASLVFSSGNGNRISFADVDAGAGPMTVTLTATGGMITLSGTAGLSFSAGDGTADPVMTFSGSPAALNVALNGLTFTPPVNANGPASVQITTNDGGNAGAGGAMSDSDTVAITVNAVNDAPVNTVPGAQSLNEDGSVVFSAGNGNAIGVSDIDAGSGLVQVTLTATNGAVTLSGTAGLTFTAGDGTADGAVTFSGTLADVNAALGGLVFIPAPNFNGSAGLQVVTSDQGNTGTGGALSDTDSVAITVNAVNDPPVNTVPAAPQTATEDGSMTFSSAGGNAITVGDPDGPAVPVRVTVTAGSGTVTLGSTSGLTFQAGDGTADGTVTFTGTIVDVNAALDGLMFTPAPNFSGTTGVAVSTDDLSNGGAGGAMTDSKNVPVTVTATPDAPVAADDAAAAPEDAGQILLDVVANDTDADGDPLTISIVSVTGGTAFVHNGGTPADPTDDRIAFTSAPNFNGIATITYAVSDGNGGTDTAVVTINVASVPDAPVAADDATVLVQGGTITIDPLANDSDADNDLRPDLTTVLAPPAHGTFNVDGVTGQITYTPAAGYSGTDQLVYQITDNTGLTATATVDFTVAAPNVLSAAAGDIAPTAGTAFSGPIATFVFGGGPTDPAAYSALINWGDGQTTGGVVTSDGAGGFIVSGAHTYGAGGDLPIAVTVTDTTGTQTATATATAHVVAPPPPPPGTPGTTSVESAIVVKGPRESRNWSVSGELTDADAGPHMVLISWGDDTTTRAELAAGDTTFDARHRFLHRSQRGPVTVTVVDGVAAAFTAHTSNELWVIDLFRRRLGRDVDAKTLTRLSNRLDRCRNQQAARDRMERRVVKSPKYRAPAIERSRTGGTPVSQGRFQ